MSLSGFLNETLQLLSLKLNAVREPDLRTALCGTCERIMQWIVRLEATAVNPSSAPSPQELLSHCHDAERYCRAAGFSTYANRFLKVANHLSALLNRPVGPTLKGDSQHGVTHREPSNLEMDLLRQLDEIAKIIRDSQVSDSRILEANPLSSDDKSTPSISSQRLTHYGNPHFPEKLQRKDSKRKRE